MEPMNDDDELHEAYMRAIEGGFKQVSVANATGIPVVSLRKYKAENYLGREHKASLKHWLEINGFMPHRMRTLGEQPDVLTEIRNALELLVRMLDNPDHSRDKKARLLLNQIEVIHREHGPQLFEMGKLPD